MKRVSIAVLAAATALVLGASELGAPGSAGAEPAFPKNFPSDQNQLPQLPTEGGIYDALPIQVPSKDRWYREPSNLASYRPGQIIRTREVQTRVAGIPFPVYTKQLLYRSENMHGDPIATATTVIIPGIPWVGSSRPVLSFQEAIDATDSSCNPSHTLQTGTFKEASLAVNWLAQGFAINVPDFDGQFNTFTTWDEGKMVLDSIRAVKNDKTLNLRKSGFALYGYSGGGSASIRAAGLRKTYAPDVELLGTALGGTPGDLVALAEYAAKKQTGIAGVGNFTMWLGFAGFSREYPEVFDAEKLLNKKGQGIVADMEGRCIYTAVATGMYRPINDYFKPGKSIETEPAIIKVLEDNSLDKHIPDTPILWFHGMWDELIPPSVVTPTVRKYRDAGADIRFVKMPLPEHVVNASVDAQPAQAWTSAILRGMDPGPTFWIDYPGPFPEGFPGA